MKAEPLKVLLIEDNPGDARLIREMLRESVNGLFELDCVERLLAGVEYLALQHPDIVLLDLGLPDSLGLKTLSRLLSVLSRIPVIVLTGMYDESLGIDAVRLGAQDYLVKGHIDGRGLGRVMNYAIERNKVDAELNFRAQLLDKATDSILVHDSEGNFIYVNEAAHRTLGYTREELMASHLNKLFIPEYAEKIESRIEMLVDQGKSTFNSSQLCKNGSIIPVEVHSHVLNIDSKKYILSVVRDITERNRLQVELKQSNDQLQMALKSSINAAARMVEIRDPYTAGHQQRVATLSTAIAREIKLPDDQIKYLGMAASVHDIGKMYVPAEILSKSGSLTELELQMVKTHAQGSYEVLKTIEFPWPIAKIVWQHHERIDGSGYPNGLKGDDILLEARIIAVADTVEAMSSHRPYRAALGIAQALEQISKNKGKLYDATIVEACIALFLQKGFQF